MPYLLFVIVDYIKDFNSSHPTDSVLYCFEISSAKEINLSHFNSALGRFLGQGQTRDEATLGGILFQMGFRYMTFPAEFLKDEV